MIETKREYFFSVIIPVYNKEQYLDEVVRSLEKQTYHNFEIVLIDDGSPDKCPLICDSLARQFNNITVIHQNNCGVSIARNNGVLNSRGEYVCFLDADDMWFPNFLLHLNEILNDTGKAMAFSARYNEYPNGEKVIIQNKLNKGKYFIVDDLVDNFLYTRTSGFSISRKLFMETGGFKPGIKRGEDIEFMIRAFLIAKSAVIDNRLNFVYRCNSYGNTDNTDIKFEFNPIEYYNYPYPVKSSLYKYVTWAATIYILKAVRQKHYTTAFKMFFKVKWLRYIYYKFMSLINNP